VLLRAAQRSQDEAAAAERHSARSHEAVDLERTECCGESETRKERRDWEGGKILDAAEVAKLLRLSAPTVIRLMKDGTIPARGHSSKRCTFWSCHRADINQMFRHPKLKLQSRLRARNPDNA